MAVTLKFYQDKIGENGPFEEWLSNIENENPNTAMIIHNRLRRIEVYGDLTNFRTLGDFKKLKGVNDLFEFRIDYGPGYRIYWSRIGEDTILLLRGGIKKTQKNDIKEARVDWENHKSRS